MGFTDLIQAYYTMGYSYLTIDMVDGKHYGFFIRDVQDENALIAKCAMVNVFGNIALISETYTNVRISTFSGKISEMQGFQKNIAIGLDNVSCIKPFFTAGEQ